MVEVDATTVVAGTTAFTISTTDYDSDQITFAYTCTGACPFDVFHCELPNINIEQFTVMMRM